MDDAHIRSINDWSLHLKNRDPEQVKTICQRRHQLNNRPVPEAEAVGQDRGREGPATQPHTSLSGGTVSMAICSATSGSLKGPWRYTRCPSSLMLSLNRSGRR